MLPHKTETFCVCSVAGGAIITTNTSDQHNIFPFLAAYFLFFSDFYTLLLLMLGSIQQRLHTQQVCLWLFSASAV